MTTRVVMLDPERPDPQVIAEAAEVIRRGGLVAFPTETVYGLGANALDAAAVQRIFEAKGRPATDPLIVHIAHMGQLGLVAAHVLFWWHPVVWWARREIEAAEEACCDAWVVKHQAGSRRGAGAAGRWDTAGWRNTAGWRDAARW